MSFKLAKTLVTQDRSGKSEAVDKCIEQIYAGKLEPSPDEIKWAVEVTPELLGLVTGVPTSGQTTGLAAGLGIGSLGLLPALGPVGLVAGMGIGLAVDAWRVKDVRSLAELPRSPDGAMMLRLCTALLWTNKLLPDQIDQLKAVADKAIEELWENKEDCTAFIDATKQGITAVEKWEEVHDTLGSSKETYEFDQEVISLTSANANLKLEIKASVKDVPFYLGSTSAETSFQMSCETAWSETKKIRTHQTFELTVGKRRLLAKKIMHVKQGAASKDFFVGVHCFTLEDFIRVTGLTPENGLR